MSGILEIEIHDIFRFQGGRTVFAALVEGNSSRIRRGRYSVWIDGECRGNLDLEGEDLLSHVDPAHATRFRSLSTRDSFHLDQQQIAGRKLVLRPLTTRGEAMHRHLLGVESPPPDHVADPMTLGPFLPEGWDGDAWEKPGGGGSFLRAWNKQVQLVAYGRGTTYSAAREMLLTNIREGAHRVQVLTSEAGAS